MANSPENNVLMNIVESLSTPDLSSDSWAINLAVLTFYFCLWLIAAMVIAIVAAIALALLLIALALLLLSIPFVLIAGAGFGVWWWLFASAEQRKAWRTEFSTVFGKNDDA